MSKSNAPKARDYLRKPYVRSVVPESDGTFRAEIMEFPGCIATGNTAAEALAKLEDVAESWLESAIAKKQKLPEPVEEVAYSGKLVLRLPKTLHRKAAHAAMRDSVSLNTFIVNSLAQYVGGRASSSDVANVPVANLASVFVQVRNFYPLHPFFDFYGSEGSTGRATASGRYLTTGSPVPLNVQWGEPTHLSNTVLGITNARG